MADLLEISQVVYDTVFPNATEQAPIKVEHVIEKAKTSYAWHMWRISKEQKREDGYWDVPSSLLKRATLEVKDNVADLAKIKVFRSFEGDVWMQQLGDKDCKYMLLSSNLSNILDDDEYLGNKKPATVVGNTIEFRDGLHSNHEKGVPILYASNGDDLEDSILVDDMIAEVVSNALFDFFKQKLPADNTENSNSKE